MPDENDLKASLIGPPVETALKKEKNKNEENKKEEENKVNKEKE